MNEIHTDKAMREALDTLDDVAQRVIAARFVTDILEYTDDDRVKRAVDTASKPDASEEELRAAHRSANAAALAAHAKCGENSEWEGQSPYFVARAAAAATGKLVLKKGKGIAWSVAMQCRMASCCLVSEDDPEASGDTCINQRRIVTEYLNS